MDREKAMYALEDILGGFAAVGCMTVRILYHLAQHDQAQEEVRKEADEAERQADGDGEPAFALAHGQKLHWTRAAIFETVRLTCSPIVPHRAVRDSSVAGYGVKEGTVVFINNHLLSFDKRYWEEGETDQYKPERFLKPDTSDQGDSALVFRRPWHFRPFSHGKRSCMGYKMVENICQVMTVAVTQAFNLRPIEEATKPLQAGVLGLPIKPVLVRVEARERQGMD